MNIYHSTIFVGQKFRSGLAGWVWLRFSCEVAVKTWATSSEVLTGAGGFTSKVMK